VVINSACILQCFLDWSISLLLYKVRETSFIKLPIKTFFLFSIVSYGMSLDSGLIPSFIWLLGTRKKIDSRPSKRSKVRRNCLMYFTHFMTKPLNHLNYSTYETREKSVRPFSSKSCFIFYGLILVIPATFSNILNKIN